MLVGTKKMLRDAQRGGYAVGAFNAENAEMVWAIMEAAKELQSPVIIQTTSSTLRYLSADYFAHLARAGAAGVDVPIAIHLDHGASAELCHRCIDAGYTSVMIDGSQLSLEDNIRLTTAVTDYAANFCIPVEAELGKIGGKEDDTSSEMIAYTDPQIAARFVAETEVDSLAIAIGTAHGVYKTAPVLDLDRITAIRRLVEVPLVMHGASGLADDVMREAIANGISKINFATELRIAYTTGTRAYLAECPEAIDPKAYGTYARQQVKALVMEKIRVCGSSGKG